MAWLRGSTPNFTLAIAVAKLVVVVEQGPSPGTFCPTVLRRHPLGVYAVSTENKEQRHQDRHEYYTRDGYTRNGTRAETVFAPGLIVA